MKCSTRGTRHGLASTTDPRSANTDDSVHAKACEELDPEVEAEHAVEQHSLEPRISITATQGYSRTTLHINWIQSSNEMPYKPMLLI